MDVNLVLRKKNGSQKSFSLPSSATVIGRRGDCDLCIPLVSVSRRHCQINCHQGVVKLRDLDSRNGTHVNGEPIDEAVIRAGDRIQVGPLTFVLQVDGQPETIAGPDEGVQNLPQQNVSIEDRGDPESDTFGEPDEFDFSDER